jgi:hypothetical protein
MDIDDRAASPSAASGESFFFRSQQLPAANQRKRLRRVVESDDELPAAPSDDDAVKPRKRDEPRKRDDRQRRRASDIKVFYRTLEDAIAYMLGESSTPARPLDSDRFNPAKIDSIIIGPTYEGNAIGFAVPVWIEGDAKPIFVDVFSRSSTFFERRPLSCAHIDPRAPFEEQRPAAAKLCAPTKGIRKPQQYAAQRPAAAEGAAILKSIKTTAKATKTTTKPTKPTTKATTEPAEPAKPAKLAKTA